MPKRPGTLPLALPPRPADAAIGTWLGDAIRGEILAGRLRPGTRLPATRELAAQYGVARGTVVTVFEQLRAEGYLVGTVGSGTHVRDVLPEALLNAGRARRRPTTAPPRPAARTLSRLAQRLQPFTGYDTRPIRAFRANQPALDLFPTTLWAQAATRVLRRSTARHLLGCETFGYLPLREQVVDYLQASRGVRCEVAQVAVVSGAQEALDLVVRLTVNEGDRVVLEDPGYSGTRRVLQAAGARIVPGRVDHEGLVAGDRTWRDARFVYTTPAHQMPLGITMTLPRRIALLRWAAEHGAIVFEDDYDAEYRYAGRPVPAMQGLDTQGVVAFCGSFSKVLFPSLRLGYLVVPPDLVEPLEALKSVASRHATLLDQVTLAAFMDAGHFGRHVRRMREVYAARCGALIAGAKAHLDGLLEVPPIDAGLQTVGWLLNGMTDAEATRAAAAVDVDVSPLSRFWQGPAPRQGLQLGFAAVDEVELDRGIRALASAIGGRRRFRYGSRRRTSHS